MARGKLKKPGRVLGAAIDQVANKAEEKRKRDEKARVNQATAEKKAADEKKKETIKKPEIKAKIFRDVETGRPSGVRLPNGKTFLGIGKNDIKAIIKSYEEGQFKKEIEDTRKPVFEERVPEEAPVVKPTGFESIREEIGPEEEVEGEVGGRGLTEEEQDLADKKQAEIDAWEEKGFVGKMFEPPPKLGDQLGFPLPIGPPGLKALQEGGKAAARFGGFRKVDGRLEVLKVLDEGAVSIDDLVYSSVKTNKGMAQVVERKGNEIINFGKSRGLDGGFLGREIKNINKKGQNELWKYINKLGKSLGVGAAVGTGGFLAVGGPTLLSWFAADNIGTMNNMEAGKIEERYIFGEGRFTKEETLEDLDDLIASQKEAARSIRDTRSKAPILNFFGIGKSFQGNSDDILIKLEELRNDIKIGKIIAIERR